MMQLPGERECVCVTRCEWRTSLIAPAELVVVIDARERIVGIEVPARNLVVFLARTKLLYSRTHNRYTR